MNDESVIHAYQKILPKFQFPRGADFAEEFAIKRFFKKMEVPDVSLEKKRRSDCWDQWISFDEALPSNLVLPPPRWYKAREIIHKALEGFTLGDVSFSSGSEFTPNRGRGSIQQKLSTSAWDCTRDNIELFAQVAYSHVALKKAVRERFKNLVLQHGTTVEQANKSMWRRLSHLGGGAKRAIWLAKVTMVVNIVKGSRFSTVRKNNEKNRPINVEPFCNMITQRMIGLGLVRVLKDAFGLDLGNGKQIHALLISCASKATIDLKNASDSVTLALIRFLFPRKFVRLLEETRSQMVLGLDGSFHLTRKISAMGNGFTFELMTLVILALTRVYDSHSSVFGDDIIVENSVAKTVCEDLEAVGFVVNKEKSFIDSTFRESCGANYLDDYGYIDSFDFEYPLTIGDCVSLHNKAYVLGRKYEGFRVLYKTLTRIVSDNALLGRWVIPERDLGTVPCYDIPPYFARFACKGGLVVKESVLAVGKSIFSNLCIPTEPRFFWGYEFESELTTKTLGRMSSRQWAKYYMYLHAGRKNKDVSRGRGRWRRVLFVSDGSFSTRWKSLASAYKA